MMRTEPPLPEDLASLYHRAFDEHGARTDVWMGGGLPSRSNSFAVPVSKFQSDVLRLLAAQRSPCSYIAVSIAINRQGPRYSADIDIFHDSAARQESAVKADFRFFPTQPDELFGYVLHPVDLATNKASAAADRREPRDVVDLVTIHENILPLGAVVAAACGKFIGTTPEEMLAEITRHSRFPGEEFRIHPASSAWHI